MFRCCVLCVQERVGMEAVNDAVYLEACVYKLLKLYIRHKPYYVNILELFHEVLYTHLMKRTFYITQLFSYKLFIRHRPYYVNNLEPITMYRARNSDCVFRQI